MRATHGGDLESAAASSGRPLGDLLDFSANINPLGPPPGVAAVLREAADDPEMLMHYPDPLHRRLRAGLARHLGVAPEAIAIGNGSAALIDAIVRALRPKRCLLPVPAFSEYRKALGAGGVEVVPFPLDPGDGFRIDPSLLQCAAERAACDLCIFSNPHNPSGALLSYELSCDIARRLERCSCTTVIDEAFIEYAPDADVTPAVHGLPGTIVLRSLTKFFAIPAMRIGYGVGSPELARAIEGVLPSWPVGSVASRAALAAIADAEYAARTVAANDTARAALRAGLGAAGYVVFASAANFLLADVSAFDRDADRLRERLIRESGIVVRSCSDYDVLRAGAYVRVAVRRAADNRMLIAALQALF